MATETVTVVFTDLVGSTALLSDVGEEAAEALRREHFGLLRAAIEPTGGREVKNLGDGLMVVFSSAADAVSASVAIQQAFEHRNRRATHALSVRVGVSVGDADVEDGDYFGVPVVEAARLCARSDGAEILASDMVRLLAGSRGSFVFEPIGAVELKGLDKPVEACRIGWEPIAASQGRAPLPARLSSAVSGTFVGRAEEHERLMSAWKAVTAEAERRVMLLSGEPGIGKTTLSARFARDVYEQGATVVYGRCDEDLGVPYQPWIEALSQLVAQAPEEVLVDHVTERGGHLARLVPDLARRVAVEVPAASGGDGDGERFVLFGSVTDLLERLSGEEPVLVVLDDLHWADRASVQLLRHVVTSGVAMRAGVLGTFRDSEIGADHPVAELLARLHREGGVDRIALTGLSDTDLLGLLEEIAGHEMADDGLALRDAVLAETAGNPFFVGEILRHLAETGAIFQDDLGRWVSDADLRAVGLPVSVKEVVGRRLAGLGPDTDRVLALAAVIGRDFDIPLLAAVAQLDEDTVVDLCDAAVAAAVLQATEQLDRYTFAHALIEHTLYDGLSPSRRSRAHRAVAEQLEALHGDALGERSGELAHHWAAAVQPRDTAKAVHYAQLAAARALDQLAPDEALRWYHQALELLGPEGEPRDRAAILLGLGNAQKQCGVPASRETLIEAAHLADRIDDVDLLARAALATNRGFESVIGGVDTDLVAVIELALERIPDPESPQRAQLLALSCREQLYVLDLDQRLAMTQEAIATARRSDDPAALLTTLMFCGRAVSCSQTLELRRVWTTEVCELADAQDDPAEQFRAQLGWVLTDLEGGDASTLRSQMPHLDDLAARAPQATIRWTLAFNHVLAPVLQGDLDEAERLAELAFELGTETGQPDPMQVYAGQLVNIRLHQGRYAELVPLVEEVAAQEAKQSVYRAVLAAAYQYAGELDRASTLLAEDRASGFALPVDGSWSTGLCSWADAAVRLGDRDSAQVLVEQLAPFHDQMAFTTVTILPTVAHYLGTLEHLLDRHDDADRWFQEAMTIHERMESPLLVAYTHAAWASLLADRDQPDDRAQARDMAERALAAATTGGWGYIATDAAAALQRIDERSPN